MEEPLKEQEAFDELSQLAQFFFDSRKDKSFSERHPELGKMINCPVCGERHRSAHVCVPTYAKGKNGEDRLCSQHTNKGIYGAAAYRGRILKHRNAWGLKVLERATMLFRKDYAPFYKDEDAAGKMALSRALNELREERNARRRKQRSIVKESRRRNRR